MIIVPTPTPEAAKLQAEVYRLVLASHGGLEGAAVLIEMADAIESQEVVWDGNLDLTKAQFTVTVKGEQEALCNLYD